MEFIETSFRKHDSVWVTVMGIELPSLGAQKKNIDFWTKMTFDLQPPGTNIYQVRIKHTLMILVKCSVPIP